MNRYSRHTMLPEIGEEGQQKIRQAKVLVVGAGGLGSPALLYLAAAGVGKIGIIDADCVSLSNLQRQVLYQENQLGMPKAEKAKENLSALNSECTIESYCFNLDENNAFDLISAYDMVLGATDNFASRILIDQCCKKQEKPFIHASVSEYEGQLSVFNYNGGNSYADLFPESGEDSAPATGILGVLPGVMGCLMATEALKIILGIGEVLSNRLLIYNSLTAQSTILEF